LMKWEGDRWYKYDFEVEVTDHTRSEWWDGIKLGLLRALHGTIELFYGRLFQNIWGWVDYYAQVFFGVSRSKSPIKEGIRRLFVAQLLCLPDQFISPLPWFLTRRGNDNAGKGDIPRSVYLYIRQDSSPLSLAKDYCG
jgi:hypothetical protein